MKLTPLIPLSLVSLSPAGFAAAEDPAESVQVYAYLEADSLAVGREYSFVVGVELPSGAMANAGAPAPFLQLDVPASVKLSGRHVTSFDELRQNEFLQEPYERLLEATETSILFELGSEPGEGDSIGINVTAYVQPAAGKEPFFLRRRLELPLKPAAEGEVAESDKSDWGVDQNLLQIGDEAPSFELPDAGGVPVSLDAYLGKKNVIVTTYRAHW